LALAGSAVAILRSSPQPQWAMAFGIVGLGLGAAYAATRSARRIVAEASEESDEREALAEQQLEKHRKALDALADGLKSAIFVCDAKASILYSNRRAREWFRFDDPSGRNIMAVTISYELEQLVLNAARSSEPLEQEIGLNYPEDRSLVVRTWREPSGDRIFASLYDITELRRLERIRQDFVANVSHELRTPLSAIRSLAETLYDEPKAALEKRSNYLNRIMNEVDRLATIVSDLLVLSTAESNPVRKQACDLAATVRSTLSLLQPKAQMKGLSLESDLPKQLVIEANPAQMNQVAINLVDNAINYTSEGSVQVSLKLEQAEVVLVIRDTGTGIPSDDLPRIFERFYRVDKGRSRATGGTGLGLSIVKHIVEAHGGTVEVSSLLNEGTTFTVRMPVG